MPRHTGLRKTMVFITILCLTVWLGASLASAIPQTLNYQGYLTDASGTPLDGPYAMTFSVYDGGGTLLWSESHPSVGVTGGVFNVVLGSTAPISLAFDMPYFLGIQVGADPEMTPRQELTSVGYAYKAQSVETDTLNSLACATGEAAIWNGTAWGCGASGDVTAVIAGTGLVNGGTSGDVTVAISPSYRLPQTCGAGQSAIYNGTLWACTTVTDTTLTEPEVEAYVTNGPLDMASGTTVAGAPIANAIDLSAHTSHISNPHNVTASQIGALPGSGGLVNGPMIINATAGTDAVFTESGVDVPSAGAESFEFANTGGGTLSVVVNGTLIINTSAGSDAAYLDNGVEYQSVGVEIFNIRNTGGGTVELQVDGVAVQTGAEQDTLASLACASGELAIWNGTDWTCGPDMDTDTLASLVCASGEIAIWNGIDWVCGADADTDTDTLASLSCVSGEIPAWNGSAWACAPDADTIASLSCVGGQIAKWSGAAWVCSDDSASTPLDISAASADAIINATNTGTGSAGLFTSSTFGASLIANNTGTGNAIYGTTGSPVESAIVGEHAVSGMRGHIGGNWFGVGGFANAPQTAGLYGVAENLDATGLYVENPYGGAAAIFNGNAEIIGTLMINSTGVRWARMFDDGVEYSSAGVEVYNLRNTGGGSVELQVDGQPVQVGADADTLASLSCAGGEIALWNGTGWQCGADQDTDTLTTLPCLLNEISMWNGTGWQCGPNTLVADMGCTANQVLTWNGSAWVCAANVPVPMNLTGSGAGIPILDVRNSNSTGMGIYGENTPTGSFGIVGEQNIGVYAESSTGNGLNAVSGAAAGDGVFGYAANISGTGAGVYGRAASASARGVSGQNDATSTSGYIGGTYGVYGANPGGVAVFADGSMEAVGNITSGGIFMGNGAGLTNIKYSKVAIVATSGGNYTSPVAAMTNLATWCPLPSAVNPCMVKIMPGLYTITGQTLTMQPYVDVEGSGQNVTIINGSIADMVVNMASASEIRDLTVVNNIGGVSTGSGIQTLVPDSRISRVRVSIPNNPSTGTGVMLGGTQTGARLMDVTVDVTGSTQVYGVRVFKGDAFIGSLKAIAMSSAAASVNGISIDTGTSAHVEGAIINAVSVGSGAVYGVYVIGAVADLNSVQVTAQGTTFTGGVYVMTGSDVRVSDSRVKCMPGSATSGWGIYSAGANVRVSDSVITGPAEATGYAVYLNTAGTVYISGSKINNGGSQRDVYVNGASGNRLRLHGNEFGAWPTLSPSNPVQRSGGQISGIICVDNFGTDYTDTNAICYDDL